MRRLLAPLALAVALAALPAAAQTSGAAADHEALRKLKADVVGAINTRDYDAAGRLMARPFMATVLTQDAFTDAGKLKSYFESLFTRPFIAIRSIRMEAEADDYATILDGPVALAKGATRERYEMADGRVFDIAGRWTAAAIRQDGAWKVAAIHTGTNFLDNPVLAAIEKSATWFGVGGLGLGLVIGLGLGWLAGRRRAAKAA